MTHLTDSGEFKSDKYEWCPVGFFPMKFTDPIAQKAIEHYSTLVGAENPELKADLRQAIRNTRTAASEDDERQPDATDIGEEEGEAPAQTGDGE